MVGGFHRWKLTALFSYTFRLLAHNYLYFHRHSGLAQAISTAVLYFHRHSRFVRAKKEFFLRSAVPGGQPTRRGVTRYNGWQGPAQEPSSQFARAHRHPRLWQAGA